MIELIEVCIMKIGMEITGDREVIARMVKLEADLKGRIRGVVSASAQGIRSRVEQQSRVNANITLDGDGMGATIAPLPASYRPENDAASFKLSIEKAVNEVVGE